MGQTSDQIENHIEDKREDLKSNLQELGNRVKSATDWRHYFQSYTGTMVAAAFGVGFLLSTMIGRSKGRTGELSSTASHTAAGIARSGTKHEVLETWDTIKSALVGVAATNFKEVLGDVVPGFTEHLARVEGDKGLHSGNRGSSEMNH